MKNTVIYLSFILLLTGCATLNKYYMHNHDEFGVTESDLRKLHDFGWMTECYEKRIELTDEQIKEIEKFSIKLVPEDKFVNYIRIVRKKSAGKRGGNVFIVKGEGEFGNYELLVCIHNGLVNEIFVKNNPVDDKGNKIINKDFLGQFIGRTLEQSFELRGIPDDYLTTPIKLAGIQNAPLISKNIVKELKKVLAIAKVLKL